MPRNLSKDDIKQIGLETIKVMLSARPCHPYCARSRWYLGLGVVCDCHRCRFWGKITFVQLFSSQGAPNSLLVELGGVSVVRVKRFQGNDSIAEQNRYCSVAGKTNNLDQVMNIRIHLIAHTFLDPRWWKQEKVWDCSKEKKLCCQNLKRTRFSHQHQHNHFYQIKTFGICR